MANNKASQGSPADKVFDVAKPGKSAASASSRPLIVGHKPMLKDPMVKKAAIDELDETKSANVERPFEDDIPSGSPALPVNNSANQSDKKASAPSESRISIKPLSSGKDKKSDAKDKPSGSTNKVPVKVNGATDNLSTAAVSSQTTAVKPTGPPKVVQDEIEKLETEPQKSESADNKSASATQKKADKDDQVDEVKNAEAEKLVESKQYHVPIGQKTRKKRSNRRLIVGALLTLLLGGLLIYLMIDVGLIKTNIKLPFEFFKDSNISTTTPVTPPVVGQSNTGTDTGSTNYKVPDGYSIYESKTYGFKFAYPEVYGKFTADSQTLNEAGDKNLQAILLSGKPSKNPFAGLSKEQVFVVRVNKPTAFETHSYKYGPDIKLTNGKWIVTKDNSADPTPYKVGSTYTPDKTSKVNGVTIYTIKSTDEGGLIYTLLLISNNRLIEITLPEFDTGNGIGEGQAKNNSQKPYDAIYNKVLNSIAKT